jgi:hypothetical protein
VSLSLVTFNFFLRFFAPFLLLCVCFLLRGFATLSSLFASLSDPESELESSRELSSLLETFFFVVLFLFFSFFVCDLDLLFFYENKINFNAIYIAGIYKLQNLSPQLLPQAISCLQIKLQNFPPPASFTLERFGIIKLN